MAAPDPQARPLVVVVGGGFGGLAVARGLANAPVDVVVLDRQNHHVFQPLLYQVATASLSPADISAPIRLPLSKQHNAQVGLVEVESVDLNARQIKVEGGRITYDYLVLAAGASHDYFGRDDWADKAPGLKTLQDATAIRRRLLLAFEGAEHEADAEARSATLTFVVVGGGPTGVELAGAIQEIATRTLPREYRNIDTRTARVILIEGQPRVLSAFPEEASARAQADLERLGVEVRVSTRVTDITDDGVFIGDQFIGASNVLWAAGVRASGLGQSLGAPLDRAGRVRVEPDLSVPGHPEVFVIGDMASITPEGDDQPVPGVAQGAIQMGRHVGQMLTEETRGRSRSEIRTAFRYKDKGSMAIIGRNRAVASMGRTTFGGFVAWVLWAVIHVAFLIGYRNRIRVLLGWALNYVTHSRDARLIIGPRRLETRLPAGRGFTPDSPDESPPEAGHWPSDGER